MLCARSDGKAARFLDGSIAYLGEHVTILQNSGQKTGGIKQQQALFASEAASCCARAQMVKLTPSLTAVSHTLVSIRMPLPPFQQYRTYV